MLSQLDPAAVALKNLGSLPRVPLRPKQQRRICAPTLGAIHDLLTLRAQILIKSSQGIQLARCKGGKSWTYCRYAITYVGVSPT